MKSTLSIILLVCFYFVSYSQNTRYSTQANSKQQIFNHEWALSVNVTRTTLLDPNFRFEYFLPHKKTVHSIFFSAGYQFHYKNEFGMSLPFFGTITQTGEDKIISTTAPNAQYGKQYRDEISLGVYQGPDFKLGYTIGKFRKSGWQLYTMPALGIKYQWYDHIKVRHDEAYWDNEQYADSYRIQSGKRFSLVPQINLGIKRIKPDSHIFTEALIGISYHYNIINRTIYEWNEHNLTKYQIPFNEKAINETFGMIMTFAVGYIY